MSLIVKVMCGFCDIQRRIEFCCDSFSFAQAHFGIWQASVKTFNFCFTDHWQWMIEDFPASISAGGHCWRRCRFSWNCWGSRWAITLCGCVGGATRQWRWAWLRRWWFICNVSAGSPFGLRRLCVWVRLAVGWRRTVSQHYRTIPFQPVHFFTCYAFCGSVLYLFPPGRWRRWRRRHWIWTSRSPAILDWWRRFAILSRTRHIARYWWFAGRRSAGRW